MQLQTRQRPHKLRTLAHLEKWARGSHLLLLLKNPPPKKKASIKKKNMQETMIPVLPLSGRFCLLFFFFLGGGGVLKQWVVYGLS